MKNARSAAAVKNARSAAAVKNARSAAAVSRVRSSQDPLAGTARVVRVVALGGCTLLLAAGAHTLGGGALPGAGALSAYGLVLGLLGVVFTNRRLRFPTLLAILTLQQAGLHLLFHASSAVHGCDLSGAAHPDLSMPGMSTTGCGATTATDLASGLGMWMGWPMLLAHLGATLLTAALLARGEVWCWRLGQRVIRAAGFGARQRPALGAAPTPSPTVASVFPVRESDPGAPRGPPGGFETPFLPA